MKKNSIVSIIDYLDGIKYIHEITENKFIICTSKSNRNRSYYSFGYSCSNEIFIQIMELKEITKEEINKKLNDLKEVDIKLQEDILVCFLLFQKKMKILKMMN